MKCKISITSEENKEKKDTNKDFKVDLDCEDPVNKKKIKKSVSCPPEAKFMVFKIKKEES